MKRIKRLVAGLAIFTVILFAGLYFAAGIYYRKSFGPGVFINSVYCTGRSVEEVNEELKSLYGIESFSVQDAFGHAYEIPLAEVGFDIDYYSQLKDVQNSQQLFSWIFDASRSHHKVISPSISLDAELLKKSLAECGIFADNAKENTVEIRLEQGYVLYDGMQDVLDEDMVFAAVHKALTQGIMTVDVSCCYSDLPYTEEMLQTIALYEKVEAFTACGITYDMGDGFIALSPDITSSFIALNEDGSFMLDEEENLMLNEEGIEEFIDTLCAEYDTYGSTRTFLSTRGDVITIEGGTYGNVIDREAEIAYLRQAFFDGVCEVHIPSYDREAYTRGKNDIGNTYLEVDMTMQKLYYYKNGELLFETDIVTGNTGRRMGTPEGVNFIYSMQRNRILRGPGYESPVKYWVPVKGSIGIHDASWRKEFGGEIYKTNGSHGCINVPKDVMGELYDMLETGIPVVMFY